ncbi:MAG TPA: hypothetical protein VGE26_06870 [Sphingobacteriaceae bacterium]
MGKAVIGIFDSATEAQDAVRQLENRGITRDHVDITERTIMDTDRDEGIGESISNFFSNLFGNDDSARNYSEVAKKGCTVTVYTDTHNEAEDVADILDDCGAIDVDERASQYRSGMGPNVSNPRMTTGSSQTPGMETDMTPGDISAGRTAYGQSANRSTGGSERIHQRSRIFDSPQNLGRMGSGRTAPGRGNPGQTDYDPTL